jgi:hypothetical protein
MSGEWADDELRRYFADNRFEPRIGPPTLAEHEAAERYRAEQERRHQDWLENGSLGFSPFTKYREDYRERVRRALGDEP